MSNSVDDLTSSGLESDAGDGHRRTGATTGNLWRLGWV